MIIRGNLNDWMMPMHGYGNGNGYGYGYGDGYGYGNGYGDGDGYGYGYGDGYGYGYGDGDGEGYGDGDGDGDGEGEGDSPEIYWMATLSNYKQPTGSVLAYWRSNNNGTPANGGRGTVAKVGLVEEISGPLEICTSKALHATFNPPKWKGEKIWVVAMYPPFQIDDDKIASLKREFIAVADFTKNEAA